MMLSKIDISGTEADFIDEEEEQLRESMEAAHRAHVEAAEKFFKEQLKAAEDGKKP